MKIIRIFCFAMIKLGVVRCFSLRRQDIACRYLVLQRLQSRPFSGGKLQGEESDGTSESRGVDTATSLEEYRNENNVRDQVFSAISKDGSVKVTACTTRNLMNDVMLAHSMTPTPADALGRAIACALMISNGMQDEQTLQLTFKSE